MSASHEQAKETYILLLGHPVQRGEHAPRPPLSQSKFWLFLTQRITTMTTQNQFSNRSYSPAISPFTGELRVAHSAGAGYEIPSEISPDWKSIFSTHPILNLLRPDFYVVFRYTPALQIVYQENICLDLGMSQVTYNLLTRYSKASDMEHIRKVDKVMQEFTRECKSQPFDFICKVLMNIDCPNESLRRLMRTTFVAQCDDRGEATYGVMCFHDVSVMVNSIRPNNYDVTFSPDKSYMCHEVYRRIRRILPKKNECTPREQEIIRCLDQGLSSKEIAHQLFITKSTVDTHRQNMLRKWELPNTAALLRKSKEEGWI